MSTTTLIKLDRRDPDLSKIREVARACREGKLVAFPTETVYGIGLPASIQDAAARLRSLKGREESKPFSYHIGDWAMVDYLGVERTPEFRFLSRLFWPGPLTLLVRTQKGAKIGLRFPQDIIAVALFNAVGEPFVATSANRSGAKSPRNAEEVKSEFQGKIDYLIDGGPAELGLDSTIVDLTEETPEILRAAANAQDIHEALDRIKSGMFPRKRILLVCTGNSCRTPMAAGWLMRELKQKGLEEQIEVTSCGIGTRNGAPATPEAILVMKNREIDISGHRTSVCTPEDISHADLILAMGSDHSNFITGFVPTAKNRIRVLNVPDPVGMGIPVYEEAFGMIEKKLKEIWKDIVQ